MGPRSDAALRAPLLRGAGPYRLQGTVSLETVPGLPYGLPLIRSHIQYTTPARGAIFGTPKMALRGGHGAPPTWAPGALQGPWRPKSGTWPPRGAMYKRRQSDF